MAVITVSREYGSCGEEIAREVAKSLGYSYFDKEIIEEVAHTAHMATDQISLYDEKEEHGLRVFLKKLFMPEYPRFGHYPYYPDMALEVSRNLAGRKPTPEADEVISFFRYVVEKLGERGDIVIVGRGGQKILAAKPDTFHVRFVASISRRAEQVMKQEKISFLEALEKIESIDKQRAHYLKHYYNINGDDPRLYHLVINTSLMNTEQAVEVIIAALDGQGCINSTVA